MKRDIVIILIVCVIYCIIMNPVNRALKKRVNSKGLLFLYQFLIGFAILMILYFIADLLGYGIWD